jgi:hypothetical protein
MCRVFCREKQYYRKEGGQDLRRKGHFAASNYVQVHFRSRVVVDWRSGTTDAVDESIRRQPIHRGTAPGHVLVGAHEEQRGFVEHFERLTA